ncbi:hypothetical protein INT47_000026 [Mucor saturninus]|uniref:RNA polymerase II-associated protein 1 n=1 Tax=Mucor saturninus TaxID=64648 RepID=A0A8H7RH30_9FUNG|nr:hypothetical protein INT47_000026 [Mucor saturninus]
MSKFTRPTFNVDDDDLERLQQEFFDKEQMPSAKVYRKTAPVMDKPKRSLFSERLHASTTEHAATMPALEPGNSLPVLETPALETPTLQAPDLETPSLNTSIEEEKEEFEPVMDPNPEPHVPVTKKMIDLTSLLGKVLGDITEHKVEKVNAPTLPTANQQGKTSREQHAGFPKPVHRSEFKKRLEAQRNKSSAKPRVDAPPQVASQNSAMLDTSLFDDDNDRRIGEMSQQQLEEAREEIMSTLSPESIALLMRGLKSKASPKEKETVNKKEQKKKTVSFEEQVEDKDDLLQMKKQYFEDVPTENDKLAWMDNRFLTKEIKAQTSKRLKELELESSNEAEATEAERVYRKLRFDLQGRIMDQKLDLPRHLGLHHHGDEPEKAGYTLAELFYLARSQVPSQRSMVLTTLGRIITQAKQHKGQDVWDHVMTVFTGKEHSASIYLRSALDDRNLIVLVSAIHALSALILDNDTQWEQSLLEAHDFNQFLGHVARPILPEGASQIKRKGLNDKLTELVDRVRHSSGQPSASEEEQRDDAALAERDLVRGLIKMDILPRIRYLLGSDSGSDLIQMDPASVERLVRILVRMAEAGQDVCEAIEEEELMEPVISWGIVNTQWPMTTDDENKKAHSCYPSLASVRLLTVLAQGSKQIAESLVEKASITLRFLVTSPEAACNGMKQRAYALQLETLKLIRVLSCYGYIVPTLEDLHGPVMNWLRAALSSDCSEMDATRASTAMGLLEVLLHCAADPHLTTPAHAIDWHQPTAYLPAIMAVLRASRNRNHTELYESSLGYLGAWASHLNRFPPSSELEIGEIWKAVIEEDANFESGNSVALGYTTTTNHVLRYIQFIVAYASLNSDKKTSSSSSSSAPSLYRDEARTRLRSAQIIHLLKADYSKDMLSRYAFWLWLKHCQEKEKCWGMSLGLAELESGIRGAHMGIVETWLAQDFLQLCLSTKTLGDLTSSLGPFYFQHDENNYEISKSLFEMDGRKLKSLMYTRSAEEKVDGLSSLETSAFILSPIDGLYHLDKCKVAQRVQDDAATVVANTMELSTKIFYTTDINHDVAIVSMMKIFLIGDREGRMAGMESEREIFWDERVSKNVGQWLDYLCRQKTNLAGLENAWRRSSEYIRQAQVPFFQFYQGFVAQYAAVSFGHHGFARLLVYLVTQIDTIDYRHLLFSDYRDILPTLKVAANEIPPLSPAEAQQFADAGLKLL